MGIAIYNQLKALMEASVSMECLGCELKVRALGVKCICSAASKVYQNAEMGRFLDCDKMYLYVF